MSWNDRSHGTRSYLYSGGMICEPYFHNQMRHGANAAIAGRKYVCYLSPNTNFLTTSPKLQGLTA